MQTCTCAAPGVPATTLATIATSTTTSATAAVDAPTSDSYMQIALPEQRQELVEEVQVDWLPWLYA